MGSNPKWLHDYLGERADEATELFAESISAAHDRARDAQDASRLRQRNPYGNTMWLAVHDEFVRRVGRVTGASSYRPRRAPYALTSLNRTLIYPIRHASDLSAPFERARFKVTPLRRDLLNIPRHASRQQAFDFAAIADDEAWLDHEPATNEVHADRVLLVLYVSNPEAGLIALAVGDGAFLTDGTIAWAHLDVLDIGTYNSGPRAVVPSADQPRFDSGAAPEPSMAPRLDRVVNPEEEDELERNAADADTETQNGRDG
jgi:hypothetical protein